MRKNTVCLWPILLIFLLFHSCTSGTFRLPGGGGFEISARFEPVIETRQNLIFQFSTPVIDPEKIGEWDTTRFLVIKPFIPGRFQWSGINEITFSPDVPFPFATTYTASPGPALIRLVKAAENAEPVSFETVPLSITQMETQWQASPAEETRFRCRISLNQNCLPDEITAALDVVWKGEKREIKPETHAPATQFYIQVSGIAPGKEKSELQVELVKSRLSPNLRNSLKQNQQLRVPVFPGNELVAYGASVDYSEKGIAILVRFNQNLQLLDVKPWIELPGFEEFSIEHTISGIRISGDFPSVAQMEVLIRSGLRGALGGTLAQDQTLAFRIGEVEPYIRMENQGALYLPREGSGELSFVAEGIKEISVEIQQVFPNAILSYFQQSYGYGDEEYYSDYGDAPGSLVYSNQFKINQLKKTGNQYFLPIPKKGLPDTHGFFVVKIADAAHRYIGMQKSLVVTNMGLMAKTNREEIWLQASSLETNQPISGANIVLVGRNNQVLSNGKTNHLGQLIIPRKKWAALGSPLAMVTCEKGDDFSFLLLHRSELETSRFEVGGVLPSRSGWKAEAFGPRNLYLPREQVDFSVMLRDRNLAAVPEEEVVAKIVNPMGKMVLWLKAKTNAAGMASFQCLLPADISTGTYFAEIYAGDRELLATHLIHLESFEPNPLDITMNKIPERISFGKDWAVSLSVDNMFGLPAAQRPVDAQIRWQRASFSPKGYEKFRFDLVGNEDETVLSHSSKTDKEGKCTLVLPTSKIPSHQGLLDITGSIQVFDDANIPVYKTVRTKQLTQPYLLGFYLEGGRLGLRQVNKFHLVSLNAEGNPVDGKAMAEVFLESYVRTMEQAPNEPSGYRYVSRKVRKSILKKEILMAGGKGIFSFFPKSEGDYEIEIRTGDNSLSYLRFSGYLYEGSSQEPGTEAVDREGNVDISFSPSPAKPGDHIDIRFLTPFDGRLTICIEKDKVLSTHSLETKENKAFLSLPVSDDWAPNVYVSAMLTRPISDKGGKIPLTTAYGYASLAIERKDRLAKMEIRSPENFRSGSTLPIEIQTDLNNPDLTLAVVDDGILQITQYRIPHPMAYFHQKEALQTQTFSLFGKIFQHNISGNGRPGGDGMYMKLANEEWDVKQLLSVYLTTTRPKLKDKGTLKSIPGKKGTFLAEVQIPAGFSGRVRVMALGSNARKFGFAEKTILVSDPITIKTALPDFLSPGNKFEGTATFFNTASSTIDFQPKLSVIGPLTWNESWPKTIRIQAGAVVRLPYDLVAEEEGKALVSVQTISGKTVTGFKSKTIPVTEPKSQGRFYAAGTISPGAAMDFVKPDYFLEGKITGKIIVSPDPWPTYAQGLQSLLEYPYGCLEQTVSRAFPLLHIPDDCLTEININTEDQPVNWLHKRKTLVSDAIQKISAMQQPEGGFSYWPGGYNANPYYSVYASHFLWAAQKAGYYVAPEVLQSCKGFVMDQSKENKLWWYLPESGKGKPVKKLAPAIPYALYVSALFGQANKNALIQWKTQPHMLEKEGKLMLACALILSGESSAIEKLMDSNEGPLLPENIKPVNPSEETQGMEIFKTPRQTEAFSLQILAETWPTHPYALQLNHKLSKLIASKPEIFSTQELGMTISALAQLNPQVGKRKGGLYSLNGKPIGQNGNKAIPLNNWKSNLTIQNNDPGKSIYYWVYAKGTTGKGIPPTVDNKISIQKALFDYQGHPISIDKLKINQLIIVQLRLKAMGNKNINGIAICDQIPSCFRIENKRLNKHSGWKSPAKATEPDYYDVRRDRIHLFTTAEKEEKYFYYAIRVMGKGTYYWPGAEAQAMYDPVVFSRNGQKKITITEAEKQGNIQP